MTDIMDKFQPLLDPKSIAFVGASNSPGKWGNIVLRNLIMGGYGRNIYPVNPREKKILGVQAYSKISDLPETPDLAVLIIPPRAMPAAIEACVKKGIKAGLIITAGFAEVGGDGIKLQSEFVDKARAGGMMLVGPNCNGIIRPSKKLFPEMPSNFPGPGGIGIVSQSGNVATTLSRRALKAGFGVSTVISSGNEADLRCEDFFQFLGEDPDTKIIMGYIEGFGDGRRFLEKVGAVTRKKPVVIIKAGETPAGAQAAMSHTAALAGSSRAFDGACRQAGIMRVHSIDDLFNAGIGFLNQPIARGNRTAIVTMGGGWGVMAADTCAKKGLDVVTLSDKTLSKLGKILPPWWNPGNPVDMVAGNIEGAMRKVLEVLLEAPETDCIILLGVLGLLKMGPLRNAESDKAVEAHIQHTIEQILAAYDLINELSHRYQKPVVTATELPFAVGDLEERLFHAVGTHGFALYRNPESAAQVASHLVKYGACLAANRFS
jgi:acyl-CoA synthetase (NDP forming)